LFLPRKQVFLNAGSQRFIFLIKQSHAAVITAHRAHSRLFSQHHPMARPSTPLPVFISLLFPALRRTDAAERNARRALRSMVLKSVWFRMTSATDKRLTALDAG
jgi:hypothetical protein